MSISTKQYILYLGCRTLELEQVEELAAAHKKGYGVIMLGQHPDAYKNHSIEHFIECQKSNFKSMYEMLIGYINKFNISIIGAVAWTDKDVESIANLTSLLGLIGCSPDASINVRNKITTRKLLDQLDSANPVYFVVNNLTNLKESIANIQGPSVLKHAGASGGRGIIFINETQNTDDQFISSVFQEFKNLCNPERDPVYKSYAGEFLVEEKLTGSEHSVAGIVSNRKASIFGITDKRINQSIPIQYQNSFPSKLSIDIQNHISEMSKEAINVCGINNCGFHIDFIMTESGPKILEIGGRLGGECINSHLIPMSIPSLVPYHILIDMICGREFNLEPSYIGKEQRQVAIRAVIPQTAGVIASIEGITKLQNHPNVELFYQTRLVGDRLYLPSEKYNSFAIGYFIASCPLDNDIDNLMDKLSTLININTNQADTI